MSHLFSDNGTIAPNDWILEKLNALSLLNDSDLIEKINEQKANIENGPLPTTDNESSRNQMANAIACAEISKHDIDFDVTWNNTTKNVLPIKATDTAICAPYSFSNPYDSKDYQIQSPIYYIQGAEDSATP